MYMYVHTNIPSSSCILFWTMGHHFSDSYMCACICFRFRCVSVTWIWKTNLCVNLCVVHFCICLPTLTAYLCISHTHVTMFLRAHLLHKHWRLEASQFILFSQVCCRSDQKHETEHWWFRSSGGHWTRSLWGSEGQLHVNGRSNLLCDSYIWTWDWYGSVVYECTASLSDGGARLLSIDSTCCDWIDD